MRELSIIHEKAVRIRAVIFDVDGVLTDGGIIIDNEGNEIKKFDIKDGFAVWKLPQIGFVTAIITGRKSALVERRAKDLGITYLRQGALAKGEAYAEFLATHGLQKEEVAYIGDDLIDLPILLDCGLSGAPADAAPEVTARVDIVMHKNGGRGAVREFVELILKAQGRWNEIVAHYTGGK